MQIIKRRLRKWVAPDYEQMQRKLAETSHYARYFDTFVDPQVVADQVQKELTTNGISKQICVMFTDMRGFTRYSEQANFQTARSLLNNFYDMVVHHTHTQGGIVDKFMGDGTMSLFGVFEDDIAYVERSVAAACGIVRDFASMTKQKHQPDLYIGIGLNMGPALVGNFGNGDYVSFTAIGSTVNVAARVESAARNNQVLITKKVAENIRRSTYASRGRQQFKNVSRPVEVFEITKPERFLASYW